MEENLKEGLSNVSGEQKFILNRGSMLQSRMPNILHFESYKNSNQGSRQSNDSATVKILHNSN